MAGKGIGAAIVVMFMAANVFGQWPPVEDLPEVKGLPEPLAMFDGTPVKTAQEWRDRRRPELVSLFEYYMYGKAPAVPDNLTFTVVSPDKNVFDGKAVRKIITLRFGPEGTPPVSLLLVTPANSAKPVPVFIGLSLVRDKTAFDDPNALLPDNSPWGRYWQESLKNIEHAIGRGYAVAVMFPQEICPDVREGDEAFLKGIHRGYMKPGQTRPGPHEWAAIAAWAWGLQRGVDYLVQDPQIDKQRIIVVGHSRFGKTALLAGALDERIALVIPSQAGCGGTAPSRTQVGEKVERINGAFPHWFNDTFKQFNDKVERLPFDQHCLMALVAPRPLLLTCATEDEWSNPHGQFDMLVAAAPVYELLDVKDPLASKEFPKENVLIDSRLGYFIRPGKHSVTLDDWTAWMNFADKQLDKMSTNLNFENSVFVFRDMANSSSFDYYFAMYKNVILMKAAPPAMRKTGKPVEYYLAENVSSDVIAGGATFFVQESEIEPPFLPEEVYTYRCDIDITTNSVSEKVFFKNEAVNTWLKELNTYVIGKGRQIQILPTWVLNNKAILAEIGE